MAPAQEHERRESERKCIASGEIASPEALVRFVLDPGGVVTPDLGLKLPGRGAWTRASRDAVRTAAEKGLFAKAFRAPARLPDDLAGDVEEGLARRGLAALGLARRAGKAHLGFDKVAAILRVGRVASLVIASNASPDIAAKLRRLAAGAPTVIAFDADTLSHALGGANVTYAALVEGPEAQRFLREAVRLAGFRAVFASEVERECEEVT